MVYTRRKRRVRIVRSKRSRKVWKKRIMRRRRRPARRSMGKSTAVTQILRPSRLVTMPYVHWQTYQLQDTGAAQCQSSMVWRANSIYDPSWAASGTFNVKAAAFNFYNSLYQHWTVVSSTIVVTIRQSGLWTPTSTLQNFPPLVCMLRTDDDANAGTYDWLTAVTDPACKYKTLDWCGPVPGRSVTLKKTFSTRKEYRNPKPWVTDSLTGGGTTEPAEQTYFMLFLQAKSMVAHSITYPQVSINVRIRYKVMWTEPKDIDLIPSSMSLIME